MFLILLKMFYKKILSIVRSTDNFFEGAAHEWSLREGPPLRLFGHWHQIFFFSPRPAPPSAAELAADFEHFLLDGKPWSFIQDALGQ